MKALIESRVAAQAVGRTLSRQNYASEKWKPMGRIQKADVFWGELVHSNDRTDRILGAHMFIEPLTVGIGGIGVTGAMVSFLISNGAFVPGLRLPCGDVELDHLEFKPPLGWRFHVIYERPGLFDLITGPTLSITREEYTERVLAGENTTWCMPAQFWTTVRVLALPHDAPPQLIDEAKARAKRSRLPKTLVQEQYGPTLMTLHRTAFDSPEGARALAQGYAQDPPLPLRNMYLGDNAAYVSGDGLTMTPGWDGVNVDAADALAERNPVACFDATTGRPITTEQLQWPVGSRQWFELTGSGDRTIANGILPYFVSRPDINSDRVFPARHSPSWPTHAQAQRVDKMRHADFAHSPRMWAKDVALVYANATMPDPVATLRVQTMAEYMRMSYCINGKQQDAGSNYVPRNLGNLLTAARANPGHGDGIQREMGWVRYLGAVGLDLATGALAQRWTEWSHAMIALATVSRTPSSVSWVGAGYLGEGGKPSGSDEGEPWNTLVFGNDALEFDELEAPTWQTPFYALGLFALATQLYGRVEDMRDQWPQDVLGIITEPCDAYYLGGLPLVASENDTGQWGPGRYVVVGRVSTSLFERLSKAIGPSRPYHACAHLALAARCATQRDRTKYTDAMLHVGVRATNTRDKLERCLGTEHDAEAIGVLKEIA